MQFRTMLDVPKLQTLLRSIIETVKEAPEQLYSFGFVLQNAEAKNKINKQQTIDELNVLLTAVSCFNPGEGFKFQIDMPIFSDAEEAVINSVNGKYEAAKAITPTKPTLIKP